MTLQPPAPSPNKVFESEVTRQSHTAEAFVCGTLVDQKEQSEATQKLGDVLEGNLEEVIDQKEFHDTLRSAQKNYEAQIIAQPNGIHTEIHMDSHQNIGFSPEQPISEANAILIAGLGVAAFIKGRKAAANERAEREHDTRQEEVEHDGAEPDEDFEPEI